MVHACHCIFSFYGFWMPNDPRGSGSDYIAKWELFRYGRGTKTNSRRSVAHRPNDPAWQHAAKGTLDHRPLRITGPQACAIVRGFAEAARKGRYTIHACAVLPDHVHLVIGRHRRDIRRIVGHLKSEATIALRKLGFPVDRPVWGEHGWNVFLNDVAAVERAIDYVERNPMKEGKRPQRWSIVRPFDPSALSLIRRNQLQPRRIGGAALASQERKQSRQDRGGR